MALVANCIETDTTCSALVVVRDGGSSPVDSCSSMALVDAILEVLLTVGALLLTVELFTYSLSRCLLDELSNCKTKSFNCK